MILGFTGFRFYSTPFFKKIRVYRVWLFLSFFWLFLSFFCIFCYFFHFFIIFLSFLSFWKNLIKRSIIFFLHSIDLSNAYPTWHMTWTRKLFFVNKTCLTFCDMQKNHQKVRFAHIYMQKMNFLVIFLEASLFRFRLTLPRRKNNVQKCFKNPFLGLVERDILPILNTGFGLDAFASWTRKQIKKQWRKNEDWNLNDNILILV